jgi:predicted RNA binding protein YcfA (HicA-like mRNA interferase family)
MAFRRGVWQQIKSITADQLIAALRKDGWVPDKPSGAIHPFLHPKTRKRVTIHYHPNKTYGAKLLQGLLADIGWEEADLARLGLITGGKLPPEEEDHGPDSGDENPNGQLFVEEAENLGPFVGVILCKHCGFRYGADSGQFKDRKCPRCQGGPAAIEINPFGSAPN